MSHSPAPTLSASLLLLLGSLLTPTALQAQTLAVEFIDTASSGQAFNAAGQVLGSKQVWPCGNPSNCAPVTETSVWRDGQRLVLTAPAGRRAVPSALGADGSVVGTVTDDNLQYAASRWVFDGSAYQRQDLGLLPGTTQSSAAGIDDSGRVVGWSVTPFQTQKAFLWTAGSGLADLATLGFPNDLPRGISPGGRVITHGMSYHLDQPGSGAALPTSPAGFRAPIGGELRINDSGDLGGFLASTSGSAPRFLFRYSVGTGLWQQLSPTSNSASQSNWGVGSLDAGAGLSATVVGSGVYAAGPDGLAEALPVSPAYPGSAALRLAGHRDGQYLAQLSGIGRAARLVRLVPADTCSSQCLRVPTLAITGRFIDDPAAPGSCTSRAKNKVRTTVSVVDENGVPVPLARVRARYLDDYDLNQSLSGRTNASGQVVFKHSGPACRGAIALLVESVTRAGSRFDRTQGQLSASVIPLP